MKKLLAVILAMALMCTALAACSSNAPAQSSSQAPASSAPASSSEAAPADDGAGDAEPVEMDLIWWTDGNETAVMQSLIDEYEAQNPHITINLQEIAYDDLETKLQMSIAGGEAPALSRCTETTISQLGEVMVDLAEFTDGEALRAQYLDAVDYLYMSGDKICAVPTEVTANGMLYNATAFEQAGVAVPTGPDDIWTWEEFREGLRTVVAGSDVQYGMVIDNPAHRWLTILYEFGGSLASTAGGNLSSEGSLNAINFTKELYDEGLAVSSIWLSGEDPNNLFRSGQVAVHISGTWMVQNYNENIQDFEWGVTYMPIGTTRSSVPGGKSITAFQDTGCEQEAVNFILWVTAQEQNEKYCKECLFVSPRLDNANIEYAVCAEHFAVFADELANTVPAAGYDLGIPGYTAVAFAALREMWPEVLVGSLSPEDMAAEIDAQSNEFLEENGYLG